MRHVTAGSVNGAPPLGGRTRCREAGFTLVEVLVVMAVLGGVMAAVFSLYNVQHRTAHIEEDVAGVQQNLRMGVESVTRDLRMGGFIISGPVNPVSAASNGTGMGGTDVISINTPSAFGIYARIDSQLITAITASTPITLTVSSAVEAASVITGDVVRILDPSTRTEPAPMEFTVSSTDPSVPSVTLVPSVSAPSVDLKRGFIIAKTGESSPDVFPNGVTYCVGPSASCAPGSTACGAGNCLYRVTNGSGAEVMAEEIEDLQLGYLSDGSSAEADAPTDLSAIRAVRVTLSARNYSTEALSGGPKSRELTTVVKLRNR